MLSCRRMFRSHHCLYHRTSSPNKSFHSLIKILRKHFTSFGDIRKKTQRTSGGFLRKFDPSFSGVQMWRGGGRGGGEVEEEKCLFVSPCIKANPYNLQWRRVFATFYNYDTIVYLFIVLFSVRMKKTGFKEGVYTYTNASMA